MLSAHFVRAALPSRTRRPTELLWLPVRALLVIAFTASPSLADVIYLKNGHNIVAKVLSEDTKQVVYESRGDEVTIPRSMVDRIEKGAVPDDEAPRAQPSKRSIPPSDLPLPSAMTAEPTTGGQSQGITQNAVDHALLDALDRELVKNPTAENRHRLAMGYHAAAEYLTLQGDPEAAIELYRHALKLSPDDLGLMLSFSYLMVKQTHYNEAILTLLPAANEFPKSADVPMLLGSAYYSLDNLDRAIEEWKRALSLQDSQPLREALAKAEKERHAGSSLEEIQSIHFLLRYDGSEAKGLGEKVLDTLENAFRDLQLDLDYYPRETIVVLLYSKDTFRDITRSPNWVGALNDGKIRVPVSGLSGVTPDLTRLLRHELTHSFVHLITLDRCPVWFNEGLAQLEEGASTAKYGTQLARELAGGQLPTYKDLEGSFMKLSTAQVIPAYAKSLAGLEYLRETYGMAVIRQLLRNMAGYSDFDALLQDLRLNYPSFETEVANYIEKKYGS